MAWLNHVAIAAPRNGTTSHTVDPSTGSVVAGSAFTPTAGNFLLVIVEGAVTSTTPAGWTLPSGGSAVNNTGLYVFHLASAAGSDTVTTTHNASNYPVIYDFYEFAAGSTLDAAAAATGVSLAGGAGPSLSSLTGQNHLSAIAGIACAGASGTESLTWSIGTEAVDTFALGSPTDGYLYGLSYVPGAYDSSFSSAATESGDSPSIGPTAERLVTAVDDTAPYQGDAVLLSPQIFVQ